MLDKEFFIGKHLIKNGNEPFVIAEAGSNHNQSFDTARKLIDAAAEAGAQAVKFQLFLADELYPCDHALYPVFKSIELNRDWVHKLAEHAAGEGICFLASAFDPEGVDLLSDVGVAAFKVASSEIVNFPLLACMSRKGSPLLVSTGMCDLVDVIEAVEFCEQLGQTSLGILQCGAEYPLPPDNVHLRVMDVLRSMFSCPVGFSDHTTGFGAAAAAVAREGCVIERHFTLDKKADGPDHFYAMEPGELKQLVAILREVYQSLGQSQKNMLPSEKKAGRREGLYAARDLKAGEIIALDCVAVQRPAPGLRKRHLDKIVGCTLAKDICKDEPLDWNSIQF